MFIKDANGNRHLLTNQCRCGNIKPAALPMCSRCNREQDLMDRYNKLQSEVKKVPHQRIEPFHNNRWEVSWVNKEGIRIVELFSYISEAETRFNFLVSQNCTGLKWEDREKYGAERIIKQHDGSRKL